MRYLVMECGFSYAVVLDQQGRFLKVANLGYAVGQTVDSVIPFQEEQKKSRTSRRVIRFLQRQPACVWSFWEDSSISFHPTEPCGSRSTRM